MGITRAEVLRRAMQVWPFQGVPYSQSAIHQPDGYRQDCSGFVSMCWGVPPNGPGCWGGFNTVSAVSNGYMFEIKPDELKPADAIGRCGPGTAGDLGHIQLFTGWLNNDPNDSHYYCLEQAGGSSGPRRRMHDWPSGYKAYRFRDIVDDSLQSSGGTGMASADDIIMAWSVGLDHTRDGSLVAPVVWRVRDEKWQTDVNTALANLATAVSNMSKQQSTTLTDAQIAAIAQAVIRQILATLQKQA